MSLSQWQLLIRAKDAKNCPETCGTILVLYCSAIGEGRRHPQNNSPQYDAVMSSSISLIAVHGASTPARTSTCYDHSVAMLQ
jgi:hypothetical protein